MLSNKVVISGVVITAAVVVLAIVGFESQLHKSAGTTPRRPATAQSQSPSASPSSEGPATFQGPDGTQARWVIQENDKPGTTAWEIHGKHGGIDGFANQVYAEQGQRITLYVSTTGPAFRAQAFRMGYYRASHVPAITRPLIASAETEATQTIRDSFIQPAVNALGYRLASFTLGWAAAS